MVLGTEAGEYPGLNTGNSSMFTGYYISKVICVALRSVARSGLSTWRSAIHTSRTRPSTFSLCWGRAVNILMGKPFNRNYQFRSFGDYKIITIALSEWEDARLATVLAWVKDHSDDSMTDVVLTNVNISCHLFMLDQSYVLGRCFLRESPTS